MFFVFYFDLHMEYFYNILPIPQYFPDFQEKLYLKENKNKTSKEKNRKIPGVL
jgi:hypothetical protein